MNITLLATQTTVVPAVDVITTLERGNEEVRQMGNSDSSTAFVSTFINLEPTNDVFKFETVNAPSADTAFYSAVGAVDRDIGELTTCVPSVIVTAYKQKSWKDQLTLGSSETTAPMIEFWS